ncbi:MAG: hypothetical protein HYW02_00065 [Deltaproteobacteria bacterium]|nr:hypothetical protein [Deltaproteobacteria bacterium]MBI2499882.1 hypothetical protein [Deltaproteobacteria bacterium]
MAPPTSYIQELRSVLKGLPDTAFEEGMAECARRIDEARANRLKWEEVGDVKRATSLSSADQRSGFTQTCYWTGKFLRDPKSEPTPDQVRHAFGQVLGGYVPYDFLLRKFGIDPNEAEQSTLKDPKIYIREILRPGSTLNAVHVISIVPTSVDEAARLLGLEAEKMKDRSDLILQSSLVGHVRPNVNGQTFQLHVGIKLPPCFFDREFTANATATKRGKSGEPGESFELLLRDVPGSGEWPRGIKRFEGRVKVWRIDEKRFLLYMELFADLDVFLPSWFVREAHHDKMIGFAKNLISEIKQAP